MWNDQYEMYLDFIKRHRIQDTKEEEKMLGTNFTPNLNDGCIMRTSVSPAIVANDIALAQCRRELKEANEKIDRLKRRLAIEAQDIRPTKIIRNKRTTIVLWDDGTKTIVRCEPHKHYDAYEAFTAALAKKIYGNNTRLKKMILEKYTSQT